MSTVTDDTGSGGLVDRLTYLLMLSRPRFWFYLAGPIVVGVAVGATTVDDLFLPTGLALFAYFLLPANVLLYGVNDIFDAEIDTENPKKDDKEVRWQGDRLVTAAVILCGLLGVGLLGLTPPAAWPWLVGFLFLAVEYSAPPLRFKTTPFLDSISNGLYILPGIAAYVVVAGIQPPLLAVAGAWLWTMGMHTFSAIPDIEPDRAAGIRTTATALGERWTYGYVASCWVAAALAFGAVDLRLGALLAVYPIFVVWVSGSSVAVARAYWWFPALNTAVGTLITLGALWEIVPVWEVLP
ncbi:prenyltransferase [Halohasta litorea]|uniref:Prenyltransferase n=1 Tax=Halohasta litorea TaxID=869891 RepID=A0ABD6D752_9EURY|nr:prenyltransferase [Halohasta litorea]